MNFPIIEQKPTTWTVTLTSGREVECATLVRAVEVAQQESETMRITLSPKVEKAPYTGKTPDLQWRHI